MTKHLKLTVRGSLAEVNPYLAAQLVDQSLATTLMPGSGKKVEWRCEQGHVWETQVKHRSKGTGCPYCFGRLPIIGKTDLATLRPDLAAQLVDQSLAATLTSKSAKKVEWRCEQGHVWETKVYARTDGEGCPYCFGRLPIIGKTDLATLRPDLAAQLVDQSLATTLTPGSSKKVKWRCEQGHIWETEVSHRNKGTGCPYCTNRKVLPGYNDLATTHPTLAKQLVNQSLATILMPKSRRKVEWRCEEGHVWQARVFNRAKRGCPICNQSRGESRITEYLKTHHISHKPQWTHTSCKNKQRLRFDFAIFDTKNDAIPAVCIEYQGIQHFTPREHFGGKREFKQRQQRDTIKRQFCKENGIPLIEIPFSFDTQELVDAILDACLASIAATRTQ